LGGQPRRCSAAEGINSGPGAVPRPQQQQRWVLLSVEAACARQVNPWLSLSLSLPLSPSPLLLPVRPSPSIGQRAHAERDRERGQLPGMSSQRRRPPCALPLIGRCSVAWPGLVLLPAGPARPGHSRDARRPMALARPPVDRISRPVLRTVQGYGGGVWRAQRPPRPGRIGSWDRAWWSPAPCRRDRGILFTTHS